MTGIIVLVVIAVFVIWQAMGGSLARSIGVFFSTLIGAFAAMGFYEKLAGMLIERDILADYAQAMVFALLFIVVSAVLIAVSCKLIHKDIHIGRLADKFGGAFVGLFSGITVAGGLIIAVSLANISPGIPYSRFPGRDAISPEQASSVLFNPDGFVAGFFGLASRGSLAGEASFAKLNPCYLDQLAIGRIAKARDISPTAHSRAIAVPEEGVRPAPAALRDSQGRRIEEPIGERLVLVRARINERFLMGQVRLVVQETGTDAGATEGSGPCIYPAGYMMNYDQLAMTGLNEDITPERGEEIDLAFYVPEGMEPVLLVFKRGAAAATGGIADAR